MESINEHDLMKAYIKANYKDTSVLVIDMRDCDSDGEVETLKADLNCMGYLPPMNMFLLNYIIIEMQPGLAKRIINMYEINMYEKSSIFMELFEQGKPTHEN